MPSEGNQTRKPGQGGGLANDHLLEVGITAIQGVVKPET